MEPLLVVSTVDDGVDSVLLFDPDPKAAGHGLSVRGERRPHFYPQGNDLTPFSPYPPKQTFPTAPRRGFVQHAGIAREAQLRIHDAIWIRYLYFEHEIYPSWWTPPAITLCRLRVFAASQNPISESTFPKCPLIHTPSTRLDGDWDAIESAPLSENLRPSGHRHARMGLFKK
jgi:hypothetical protein